MTIILEYKNNHTQLPPCQNAVCQEDVDNHNVYHSVISEPGLQHSYKLAFIMAAEGRKWCNQAGSGIMKQEMINKHFVLA